MKRLKLAGLLIMALLILAGFTQYPKLTIISGFASKSLASTIFLANRSIENIQEKELNEPLIRLSSNSYSNESGKSIAFSEIFGLQKRITVCRDEVGCVLIPPGYEGVVGPVERPVRLKNIDSLPYPLGNLPALDTVFPEIDYEKLNAAIAFAFSNPEIQRTRSVLVLYKDHLVAEKYADGITQNTRVLGWSMTKSILATVYGIRQMQGLIDVKQPVYWGKWNSDDRKLITYNDLLRMQSGLEWDEDYGGISDVTEMLFLSPDMTSIQPSKPLISKPGTFWNYSSGTTNFLSGLLRRDISDYQEYLDYPYRELIDKIGMHSMVLETDYSGNYVASSYGWATTRDWAKFGLLYLHKGNWNGEQIFNSDWVDYITRPTDNSDAKYGAHFWINQSGTFPDAPRDMYSANGFQGQYVFIIPSKDLVIVRTGMAEAPEFDTNGFLKRSILAFK